MQSQKTRFRLAGLNLVLCGFLGLNAVQAQAADLNICAGQNEMPFSNEKQEGFENAIGEVLGKAMDRKINFVWWEDARYVVRDHLDKNKCDVLLGVDSEDPRVLKTKPYYRSAYVFITRQDSGIDISSWNDDLLKQRDFRIGVLPDSPGKVMLLQINRFDDMFDYFAELTNYQSTRNKYIKIDVSKLVNDVASGYIDAAMLWAPEAARYVRDSKVPLKMTVIEDDARKVSGDKVPMHYDVVMGVRKDDAGLKQELDRAIDAHRDQMETILKREGMPLLPAHS